jgi:hypothetical protein
MRRSPERLRQLATACLVLASGCVRQSEPVGPSRLITPPTPGTVVLRGPDGAVTRDAVLQISLDPLPAVTTDGFVLPLLTPDGAGLAWQSRSNADWPTLLAQPEATRALLATVEGRRDGAAWSVSEPLLLGRMAQAQGLLVEAPRPDGPRWIGLVGWDGSGPTWLVQDAAVNAFATLGPRGELAWCRRDPATREFDLVVQRPEGRLEWPRREGESWMMPVISAEGVYAISLRDGVLELAFLPLRAGQAMTQSQAEPALLRKRISLRGTARVAYQTMVACSPDAATPSGGLLFFHPDLRRMAFWRPAADEMRILAQRTVAAWVQPDGSALVSLPDRLVMQEMPPEPGLAPLQVLPGLWLPRGRDGSGVILLGPRENSCQVSRLRMGASPR